jgi:tetratricopeptide (TPR) repeat protein
MRDFTPKTDAAYREYAEMQVRRHFLLIGGKGESDEAGEIEERLSSIWEGLDETQRRSLNGMAADLNWLRRRGTPPPKGREVSEVTEAELRELQAAQDAQDWHAILHHLRVCAPAVPLDMLAYSRATCYLKLDFPQISAALADLTVELSHANGQIARLAFDALRYLAPDMAFRRAQQVMSLASIYPPVLVVQCIGYVFDTLGTDPTIFDAERIVGMIQEARRRLEGTPASVAERAHFCYLAGAEMQAFRREREARELYEEALILEPENPFVLAGLGMSLYAADTPRAVELFQKAILSKATFIRPYLHLSHYYLLHREFAKAFDYARQAMDFARDDRARAAILEIMAISECELGSPPEDVLKKLSEAARLAPNSARIGENLKAFMKSRGGTKAEWNYREEIADYSRRTIIEAAFAE